MLGLAVPHTVVGTIAWIGLLSAAFAGWGSIVLRALPEARVVRLDLGLKVAVGIAGVLVLAGLPLALGVLTRPTMLALTALGAVAFAWDDAKSDTPVWRFVARFFSFCRASPGAGSIACLLFLAALFLLIGGAWSLERNAWDDDVIYTPLVRRVLDAGDLVEPFSFRRLASLGGQTILQGFTAARGAIETIHAADRGLGFGLTLILIIGHARSRNTSVWWTFVVMLVVMVAPSLAINSASYWTGAALFVAMFRSVAAGQWTIATLLGVALCTLRQNFLPVVILFLVFSLLSRRVERRVWIRVVVLGSAFLSPYLLAAYSSSRTFLYPLVAGNWNKLIELTPATSAWTDELSALAWTSIDAMPFVIVLLLLVPVIVSPRAPQTRVLTCFVAVSGIGLALLTHGLVGTEPLHVWRYAFGFTLCLVVTTLIEFAPDRTDTSQVARWLVIGAVAIQLISSRSVVSHPAAIVRDLATPQEEGPPGYARMQAAIPNGTSVAVMLDDAWKLNFARNKITNLDVPGFAALPPGAPAFQGPVAWHRYLRSAGFDYLAFTRSASSRTAFRREFWLRRLITDREFFVTMSAYSIDAIDSFAILATQLPLVHDRDGLVVLDLRGPATTASASASKISMEQWVRSFVDREQLHRAWSLSSRANVRFDDGFASTSFLDEQGRVQEEGITKRPVRGFQRIAHVALHGAGTMHLSMHGRLALDRKFSRARIDVALDGRQLTSAPVASDGSFSIDLDVDALLLRGAWHDLHLLLPTISAPAKDVHEFVVGYLESFEWEPR